VNGENVSVWLKCGMRGYGNPGWMEK